MPALFFQRTLPRSCVPHGRCNPQVSYHPPFCSLLSYFDFYCPLVAEFGVAGCRKRKEEGL